MSGLQIPAGACDSHCHIIGPPDRFKPADFAGDVPDAPLARHQAMMAAIMRRCSTHYGMRRTPIAASPSPTAM
jgi:hypothetical protein